MLDDLREVRNMRQVFDKGFYVGGALAHAVLAVGLTDLAGPDVADAAVVDVLDPDGLFASGIEAPTESPGCRQLQFSAGARMWRSVRRPCP